MPPNECYMCGAVIPSDDYICDECWEATSDDDDDDIIGREREARAQEALGYE